MELIIKIIRFELSNAFRSKWIIVYSAFFFLTSFLLLNFDTDSGKAVLSLMNIVLIIIPLVSIIFGTIYIYNSRDYIEMVLCQPINRKSLFLGLYLGNAIPFAAGFLAGTLLGFILNGFPSKTVFNFMQLLLIGTALTFIFTSISFLIGIKFTDKSRGMGFAILVWLLLSVVYDGLILFVVYFFRDYPIENVILAISLLNPIDLGRIMFLLEFNISALMGYTGALFNKFFGSSLGLVVSFLMMAIWFIIPALWGIRAFKRKDF